MKNRSESLDLVRGLAALLVMFGHVRSIFFVPYQDLSDKGLVNKIFYFITGYNHECVMVFFVLSGYFVGAAYHRNFSISTVGDHTKNYLLNRMVRLWLVLIPALVFTASIDLVGLQLTTEERIYTTPNYFDFINPSNDRSILTWIGNLFFLQTIAAPTFGTNTPLWSLANEFWYYMLFPALYVVFARGASIVARAVLAVAVAAGLYILGSINFEFVSGFVIWLMGFAAYMMRVKTNLIVRFVTTGIFLVVFIASRIDLLGQFESMVLGITTCLLIVACRESSLGRLGPIAVWLSQSSYTLYLFHLPLVFFLSATVLYGVKLDGGVLIFVALAAGIVAFSHLMYHLFERRTDQVRNALKKIIG